MVVVEPSPTRPPSTAAIEMIRRVAFGRYDPEQQENDRQRAARGGDLGYQDDLAAALDRLRSLFDLGFKPRDLVVRVGRRLVARWWPMSVGAVGLLWHCDSGLRVVGRCAIGAYFG